MLSRKTKPVKTIRFFHVHCLKPSNIQAVGSYKWHRILSWILTLWWGLWKTSWLLCQRERMIFTALFWFLKGDRGYHVPSISERSSIVFTLLKRFPQILVWTFFVFLHPTQFVPGSIWLWNLLIPVSYLCGGDVILWKYTNDDWY